MNINNVLDNLHDIIEEERVSKRLSYVKLGEVIGYSDVGIKKAIVNKTLKLAHIEKIANHFGFFDRLEKFGIENNENLLVKEAGEDYGKVDIAKLSKLARDNWDELLEENDFNKHFEAILYKKLSEKLAIILKEKL